VFKIMGLHLKGQDCVQNDGVAFERMGLCLKEWG